jgi:hypothetical protein
MRRRPSVVSGAILLLQLSAFALMPVTAEGAIAAPGAPPSATTPDRTSDVSGQYDGDDVEGPFDVRWLGASYTATGNLHLSVSFYDGFERRLLPRIVSDRDAHVRIGLSGALSGYFVRREGRLFFIWGDFGSNCCAKRRATRPSSDVLSVTINPCNYLYGEEIEEAQGETFLRTRHLRAHDWTGEIALSHPQCGSDLPYA